MPMSTAHRQTFHSSHTLQLQAHQSQISEYLHQYVSALHIYL